MLFSRNDVAEFIQNLFEPAWVSARAVPLVRIDFGNGRVLTRTLHGNIATCVCTAEGHLLDVLPGVYQPEAYLAALEQLRLLPQFVNARGPAEREARLREYHTTQAAALEKNGVAARLIDVSKMSKARIESSIKLVLHPGPAPASGDRATARAPKFESAEDIASWSLLAEDTRVNETQRRKLIHEMLATAGMAQPDAIIKRLYKEVLHADLDDPYLGLGDLLFAHYPFAKEDRQ